VGRRPKSPNAIPRFRVRKKPSGVTFYYYDHGGKPRKETPLGSDYGLAVKKWAELEHEGQDRVRQAITFRFVADRYRVEVMPTKAARTQLDNAKELAKLIEFFDAPPAPLDSIQPQHVRQYMRWREPAKIRATREKALLSHIWNWAREKGYTALANPCAGIKGTKAGRKVYVDDGMFKAVYNAGGAPLRDAMDLAYLTGQRPADVLRMDETHIREGVLHIAQGKTGVKLRFDVAGELAAVVERAKARKREYPVYATRLVVAENGQPLTMRMLEDRFTAARIAAKIPAGDFQFRDLRAKAATDKTASSDIRSAQKQLGHSTVTTTEGYVRNRIGDKATTTR